MKTSTDQWVAHRIGDLFSVSRPSARSLTSYIEGDVPFVATSDFNNGVIAMVSPHEGERLDYGNCITISPLNGCAFYQKHDFLGRGGAGSAILILRHGKLNELNGLFVAAVLRKCLAKYSYSDQLSSQSIQDETIPLPTDKAGDVAWTDMEQYMASVLEKSEQRLDWLLASEKRRHLVESKDWKTFPIGGPNGLFRIEKGTRLTRANMREGDIPFIGASTANNGVTAYIGNTEHVHPGNVITVAYNGQKATGKAFYQPKPFWASDDVHVLYPNFELNELRALFLLPIFRIVGEPYAFEDKWKVEYMEKDSLVLPAQQDGTPDWEYMESYMRDLLESQKANLTALT